MFNTLTNTKMNNLVNVLTAETADFKQVYIEKTMNYAEKEFERLSKIATFKIKDWCEYLGIEPVMIEYPSYHQYMNPNSEKFYYSYPKNFYNTKESKTLQNLYEVAARAVRKGRGGFLADAHTAAEKHYKQSIEKLAARVESKQLNQAAISVKAGWMGVNFDCIITDGDKKVKATTIIAEGPIQRPHYRYLIK